MLNENFVFFERFWKNLPAPPLNYGVFDLFGPLTIFFQILLAGVALGKAQIMTQFLVKHTEFGLFGYVLDFKK